MTDKTGGPGDRPPGDDEIKVFPMAKRTDPATSHAAALRHIASALSVRRSQVYDVVVQHPDQTSNELGLRMTQAFPDLELRAASASPQKRLPELEKLGLIIRGEARQCSSSGRVLPFNYIGPDGKIEKIEFPENLKLYQNIDTWPSDFEVDEVFIEKFLAEQLTRRAQFIISQDPKIMEAFEEIKVTFSFYPEPTSVKGEAEVGDTQPEDRFFIATLDTKRREQGAPIPMGVHADEAIQQIGDLVLREFVSVMRGYYFDQYDHLNLQISETDKLYVLDRDQLERFRKKKVSVEDLLIASPVI